MTQFGRRIIVSVAGLLISQHRLGFTINRRSDRTADDGTVDIYNLARPTEQQIFDRGREISVEAGYGGQVGLIFEGRSQRVERVRRVSGGVARITRVHLSDALHTPAPAGGRPIGGVTSRSYAGAQPVRQVAADLMADAGLAAGALDAIPASADVTNWAYTGQATDALGALLRSVGCAFWADGAVIQVRRQGAASRGDAPGFLISAETGMIGSPKDTDEGVEVAMLLNPAIQLGSGLRVVSVNTNGDFVVVELTHLGDNWEGRFVTTCQARPL